MKVTAFDKQRIPQVSWSASNLNEAVDVAFALADKHAFVKMENSGWNTVFTKHSGLTKQRLVHVIMTRADVSFS